jgi:hypothetical protein
MPSTVEASHTPAAAERRSRSASWGPASWSREAAARRRRVGPAVGWWPPGPVRPRRPGGGCLGPGPGCGPRTRARAVRTTLLAAPAPRWSRPRSQAAVEPIARSASAPAAPWASTPAGSLRQWPSRRSRSRRSSRTSSATTVSGARRGPRRPAGRCRRPRCPARPVVEVLVGSNMRSGPWGEPINPTPNPSTRARSVDTSVGDHFRGRD